MNKTFKISTKKEAKLIYQLILNQIKEKGVFTINLELEKDEPIDSNVPTQPEWVKESRRGWACLINDIHTILKRTQKKAEGAVEPTDKTTFSYYDLFKIVVVTLAGSICVFTGIKILLWMNSL